jgi:hypothetical protein
MTDNKLIYEIAEQIDCGFNCYEYLEMRKIIPALNKK